MFAEGYLSCEYCGKDAIYECSSCQRLVCGEHAKLRVICSKCVSKKPLEYSIVKATVQELREEIRLMVKRFWGEEEQLAFDKKFYVAELPAYAACVKKIVIGFVSFTELEDALLIAALGVLPRYQNAGVGKKLVEKVEAEAKGFGKGRLLVSTSNDDLPALAFYQSLGFQIFEVKPNVIAEKHGAVLIGIGGLPTRDEIRLQKILR